MTVKEILKRVGRVKPICRETLYVYFRRFNIKPVGVRQSPQRFPENSADKIIEGLGLLPEKKKNRCNRRRTTLHVRKHSHA